MKKIALALWFLSALATTNAQQKKATTKSSDQTKTKTSAATDVINENNYGTVVRYTNEIVECLNKQQQEIKDREEYRETWSNYYVSNKSNSQNKVIYSPYIAYDLTRNKAQCTSSSAPSIMGATDVNFYNENYKALRETFGKMALIWNDLATYSKSNPPSKDYGKQKCEELNSLEDNYYQIRKKLSDRNKQVQQQLFPYSVAKSPYKTAYINMYNDLNAVKDFAGLYNNYDDMIKNKESLMNTLTSMESAISEHTLYASENKTPNYYKDYYEALNNYISRTKALLNSKNLNAKQKDDVTYSYTYALKAIVPAYNKAIN